MSDFDQRLDAARRLLRNARKVTAFTGAGISTESGLSDFRSAGGLWERYRTVTYQEFLAAEEHRIAYWSMRRELIPELLKAEPNPAHRMLARLEERGQLRTVITQNIDGLQQAAGNTDVIELHGTNMTATCLNCGLQSPIEEVQQRLEAGDLDPHCTACDGLIKPDTISFGQMMPEAALERARRVAEDCDLMLMIGSSLEVEPACLLPTIAHQRGAALIFLNRDATYYDSIASVRFHESAGQTMIRLVTEED